MDVDARPQYAEPGKEMELKDFLDSPEAAKAERINYWASTEKYKLTTTAEKTGEFLEIYRL